MGSRSVLQVFHNYQKARTTFTQTIAELALKPANIESLYEANVLGKQFTNKKIYLSPPF